METRARSPATSQTSCRAARQLTLCELIERDIVERRDDEVGPGGGQQIGIVGRATPSAAMPAARAAWMPTTASSTTKHPPAGMPSSEAAVEEGLRVGCAAREVPA